MMETTVVHFSGMQVMLMIALCAIAVLVPVWAIRRIARAVPPVYQVSGIPSGVGGLLLFTIVLLIVEAVNALYHFGRAAGEAAHVISMSTDYLWPVAQTLIPDFAASFFLLIAIGALVFGRSSVALGAAVVCASVSYTHLRAHETLANLVCRLLLEKIFFNDTATTEIYTLHIVGSVRCV